MQSVCDASYIFASYFPRFYCFFGFVYLDFFLFICLYHVLIFCSFMLCFFRSLANCIFLYKLSNYLGNRFFSVSSCSTSNCVCSCRILLFFLSLSLYFSALFVQCVIKTYVLMMFMTL